jgi:hypothetical protein
LALAFLSSSGLSCAAQQASLPKGRRQVATWLVHREEKGFDRIERNAGIIDSLSVFGDPPREFIDRCHKLRIEVYRTVSGNASAFDAPARAQATLEGYMRACRVDGYDGIDPGIGFWHFSSVDDPTWKAVRDWLSIRAK